MSSLKWALRFARRSYEMISLLNNWRQVGFLRNWECEFAPCYQTRENSLMMSSIEVMEIAMIAGLNHIDYYHSLVSGSSICEMVRSLDFAPMFEIPPHLSDHLDSVHL